MHSPDDNRTLSWITLITNIGDFLSFFAVLQITYAIFDSAILAGYTIFIKSAAIVVAGIFLPAIISRVSVKRLIIATQIISACVVGFMLVGFALKFLTSPHAYFFCIFVLTFCKHLFESARESTSRQIAKTIEEHRPLQAQLLSSFFSAQTIGPLLAFFLIRYTDLRIPLGLDILSFIVATLLAFRLQGHYVFEKIRSPLYIRKYIMENPNRLYLFLLRSLGFFSAASIFNLTIFPIIKETYDLKMIYSAWYYIILGIGATTGIFCFRHTQSHKNYLWSHWKEGTIAFWGNIMMAISSITFAVTANRALGVTIILLFGLGMGLNALASQTLRRAFCSPEKFPAVVGLELIASRAVDFTCGSAVTFWLTRFAPPFWIPVGITSAIYFLLAFIYLQFPCITKDQGNYEI